MSEVCGGMKTDAETSILWWELGGTFHCNGTRKYVANVSAEESSLKSYALFVYCNSSPFSANLWSGNSHIPIALRT
jgi:hypothetical protein